MKKLIRVMQAGVATVLIQCAGIQVALAQSTGEGSDLHNRIDAWSGALGGLLGIVFVILVIRSLFKKKK